MVSEMTEAAVKPQKKPSWLLALMVAAAVKFKSLLWLGGSLVTMLLSIYVFALRDGLPYGVALVMLILIHESGHWIWMKAMGLNPKAPMFVPGLGAFVAMTNLPDNDAIHAWVALAGPLVGGVGCAVLYALGVHTNNEWLANSANTGFMLNLMQMIPAKPLDGGFIVQAVSKWLLIPGTIALFLLAMATGASLIYVIAIVSLLSWGQRPRAAVKPSPDAGAPGGGDATTSGAGSISGLERFAVAFAYLSVIGALLCGFLMSYSDTGL
jgi:Zn-dependent protease